MLALTNKISKSDRDVRNGDWGRSSSFCLCNNFPTVELSSATVGIIGYGAIGKKVAEVVKALGANILISERKGENEVRAGRTSFDDVLRKSDIISIHCPLTSETNNLITSFELSKMKKSAYIVNVARGGVVNEKDLYEALHNNVIAGAATDVLTTEPPVNNVLIDNKYPDNLIVTPHVAWGTLNARLEIIRQMSEHIKDFKNKS
jgi:glycerate dehydrogenase